MRVHDVIFCQQKWLIFLAVFFAKAAGSDDNNGSVFLYSPHTNHSGFNFEPDHSVHKFISFFCLQFALHQPQNQFNLKEYDTRSALVDNLLYAHISEMENNVREVMPRTSLSDKVVSIATPALFVGFSLSRMVIYPLNFKSMTLADMSALWGLRVGIRGTGQLLSSGINLATSSLGAEDRLSPDYFLAYGLCQPYLALAKVTPDYGPAKIISGMFCAHGSSLYQETRLADLRKQGYSWYEANHQCAQENIGLGWLLLTLYSENVLSIPALVYGTELAKAGCDCALQIIKHDYLPEKGIRRVVLEFTFEGSIFVVNAVQFLKTSQIAIDVFRAKMRDGSMYYFGARLSRYSIAFLAAITSSVYRLFMQLAAAP